MENIRSFLSFKVGKELYAVNARHVQSIIEHTKITKVPRSPEFMLGVINLRGQVLPVFDMRIKLGMPPAEVKYNTCILVLEFTDGGKEQLIGALVDSVTEVLEIEPVDIKQPSGINPKENDNYIEGFYYNGQEYIMLPDMDKLLSGADIVKINAEVVPN